MTRTPPLWCEARCAGAGSGSEWVDRCLETATGAYTERAAVQMAREAGWRVRYGEWWCPVCIKAGRVKET